MTTPTVLTRATIRSGSAAARREPLTFGVPLPPGRVHEVARLVACAGVALPTAATVLERWPDGSVRWALLDVDAEVPPAGVVLDIRDDLARPEGSPSLTLTLTGKAAVVTDGDRRLALDLDDPRLVTSWMVAGRAALGCREPIVHVRDRAGQGVPVAWTHLETAHQSALRVVVTAHGLATMTDGGRLNIRLRLTCLAGRDVLGLSLELHNPRSAQHDGGFWELGDPGSVLLQGAAVVCAAPSPATSARASLERDAPVGSLALPCRIAQHASGGEHWQSRVHVNQAGVVALEARGYSVEAGGAVTSGLRAAPALVCTHAGGELGVTSRLFWEVFPKAFEADPDGVVRIWSLPPAGDLHELQGGERCEFDCWIGVGDGTADPLPEWCRTPSTVLPALDGVAMAEHLPALHPVAPGANDVYEGLVAAAVDGDDTFLAKRELIDEFGWRHFGDLYADHENGTEPGRRFISHYNNQYDAVLGMTLQALRHDDHRWWRMAGDLARHVSRIDIYWTSDDRAAYNGGQFWHTGHYTDAGTSTHRTYPRNSGLHGGGPSNEQCYSHGLLLHYFLTGEVVSREAVISLAEWTIAADDPRRARFPLPWLSDSPTGGASATESATYHGPGRGVANSVLALLNAHRVTGDDRFTNKAGELVHRVIHPDDDIASLQLLNVERRWSYTVCLQALGRYLWTHEAGGRDARWNYARACLLHYARWMAEHEYCYLDQPEVLEFPTETWAAQDLRKSEVFDLAAWHASSLDERSRFLERARYFHARSLETLTASPTRTRTRPVVLLLQYGYARPWFERETARAALHPAPAGPWPPRAAFEPQKAIAIRRLKQLAAAGAGLALVAAALVLRFVLS